MSTVTKARNVEIPPFDLSRCPEAIRRAELSARKADYLRGQDRLRAAQRDRDRRAMDIVQALAPRALVAWSLNPTQAAELMAESLIDELTSLKEWSSATTAALLELDGRMEGLDKQIAQLDQKLQRRADLDALMCSLEQDDSEDGLVLWSLLGHGTAEADILQFASVVGLDDEQSVNLLERASALGWRAPQ